MMACWGSRSFQQRRSVFMGSGLRRGDESRVFVSLGFRRLIGATAPAGAANNPLSARLLGFGLAQGGADTPGIFHGASGGLVLRVFIEEQHDLAGRTLARIAVLQPAGALAKNASA